MLVDRDVESSHALVVDANPTSRSVTVQQLRDFGFGTIKTAGRIIDARDVLEHRQYDLVVCSYDLEKSEESGQDLLEELRREQMLPYSTVFIMVTGEATYQKVAEAAESALDSYLVRPYSANTLFTRIKEARHRKKVLKDIFEAMESKDHERAATLCLERFKRRQQYWLYAARIGAELMLSLKRNEEARTFYDAVVAAKAVPWARLGVARVHLAEGDLALARRTLESLLGDLPQYADSYDVLGKIHMEQGQLEDALSTYRMAAHITPGCILRLQHCGTLAFFMGQPAMATEMLERTWSIGSKSRLFDVLAMLLLAILRFDARDTKGLAASVEVLHRFSDTYSQSLRLRRMAAMGDILTILLEGKAAEGVLLARAGLAEISEPHFDMEAATSMLSLWSRLDPYGVEPPELEEVVRKLAQRFAVSKTTSEVLVAAVQHQEAPSRWIHETYADVMKRAEDAMNHAVRGDPKTAVEALIFHGRQTCNAKLIEMAGLVAKRHEARIENAAALLATAGDLAKSYCAPSTHIAGVRRSNRSAGGLVLRR